MQDLAVKTVDRVAAILRALSAGGPDGVALSDIADATGLSKATVHRLLTALVAVGFAYQQLPDKFYRLGAGAIALGGSAMRHHAAGIVQPILDRLAQATGDTVFASVREGGAAICVARAVGDFPIRTLTLDVGDRRPLGVGAGSLALLAGLPDAEVEGVIAQNVTWLKDFQGFEPDALRGLVARTRRDGHALNEGRIVSGMNAIGVVAMDPSGAPFASLSLAAIRDRMTPARVKDLVDLLTAEARGLEAGLMPVPRAAKLA